MKFLPSLHLQLLSFIFLLSACGENRPIATETRDNNTGTGAQTGDIQIRVDTIATGLTNPWGMAFLPDGRVLITERGGNLRIVQNGQLQQQNVQGVPTVFSRGQGGLLDIQLHPDYAQNGWIYFTYSKPGSGGATTTLARAKLSGNTFTDVADLFSVQPYINSNVHFGSRITFDGKGYVFMSTGERGTKSNSQDLNTQNGSIIRLHDDGRVPSDNPFVGQANMKPEIWAYGIRNCQGLVYDRQTDILWSHDHGPKGGDEINIIERGKNYGWPLVTHGVDYDGTVISPNKTREGIEPPLHVWTPSIAPCGLALVTGNRYRGWNGNLMVGALAGKHIARVVMDGRRYVREERLIEGMARVRAVTQAPDGYIYAVTEGPGLFLRLVPAN